MSAITLEGDEMFKAFKIGSGSTLLIHPITLFFNQSALSLSPFQRPAATSLPICIISVIFSFATPMMLSPNQLFIRRTISVVELEIPSQRPMTKSFPAWIISLILVFTFSIVVTTVSFISCHVSTKKLLIGSQFL